MQAPCNIFDQRLISSGWLQKLQHRNIEIHVRSIFLQGLLLLPKKEVPIKFLQQCRTFYYWHNWFENNPETSPIDICLDYILKLKNIDRVVIGIENLQHFNEILEIFESNEKNEYNYDSNTFKCEDLMIVNPSNWQKI